jgi:hypothetical protein
MIATPIAAFALVEPTVQLAVALTMRRFWRWLRHDAKQHRHDLLSFAREKAIDDFLPEFDPEYHKRSFQQYALGGLRGHLADYVRQWIQVFDASRDTRRTLDLSRTELDDGIAFDDQSSADDCSLEGIRADLDAALEDEPAAYVLYQIEVEERTAADLALELHGVVNKSTLAKVGRLRSDGLSRLRFNETLRDHAAERFGHDDWEIDYGHDQELEAAEAIAAWAIDVADGVAALEADAAQAIAGWTASVIQACAAAESCAAEALAAWAIGLTEWHHAMEALASVAIGRAFAARASVRSFLVIAPPASFAWQAARILDTDAAVSSASSPLGPPSSQVDLGGSPFVERDRRGRATRQAGCATYDAPVAPRWLSPSPASFHALVAQQVVKASPESPSPMGRAAELLVGRSQVQVLPGAPSASRCTASRWGPARAVPAPA